MKRATFSISGLGTEVRRFGVSAWALVAASVPCAAAIEPGADIAWAASRDCVTFDVEAGATAKQTGMIAVEPGGRFEKTGAGTMEFETARITGAGDFDLTVREGALAVTRGTATTLSAPDALLAKAALWLDAAYNVVETNDDELGTFVGEWRDRRETQTTAPFDHLHGYTMKMSNAASNEIAALRPEKATGALGAAIDFKGYGSHCLLGFQAAETGTAPASQRQMKSLVCSDVFVVHSITRSGDGKGYGGFGFLLGGSANAYHPSGAGFDNGKYFIRMEYPTQFDARWWLNGLEADASVVAASLGDYVFDAIHYGALPDVNSLYCYRTDDSAYFKRCGGDLVYEVILFTNKLTEAEHAYVRRYLTDKYGKTPAAGTKKTVRTAPGTSLEIGSGVDDVRFTGGASVTAATGADFLWNYVNDAPFGGVFALAANGTGATRVREDLALDLASDGVVTANTDPFATRGVTLSLASGAAHTLVKDGRDNAHICALPDGVTTLDVRKGVLTLSPERATSSVPVFVAATVTNPDFQLNAPTTVNYLTGHRTGTPTTFNGWTCIYSPGWEGQDAYAVITPTKTNDDNWYQYGGKGKSDTSDAWLALRGGIQVYTSVHVPATGRYDISFDLMHDMASWNPTLTVWFGPDTNNLQLVGAAATFEHRVWTRRTVRTPVLAAGDGVLVFRQDLYPNIDANGKAQYRSAYHFIDNIAMTSMTEDVDVFDIPNGNFEQFVTNAAFAQTRNGSIASFGTVFSEGWDYVQPDWTNKTTSATVHDGMGDAYFNKTVPASGGGQLVLGSSNAMARTTFTLPAGTWKLRADLAAWRRANLTAKMKPETSAGKLCASVTVNGVTTDLGYVVLSGLRAFVGTWSVPFEVPSGGADVTLTLRVSTRLCAATVDNLVCVPVGTGADDLVTDGEFDQALAADRWQVDTSSRASDTPRARVAAYRGSVAEEATQYSCVPEAWDGTTSGAFGIIGDCAGFYQTLTVPADGRYRLTYHTRMRYNAGSEGRQAFCYGFNSLRVQLSANGQTNILDETNVGTTNWVRHTAVFTARAGTYEFRVAGLNVPTKTSADSVLGGGWDKRAFVDGISIVPADQAAPPGLSLPGKLAVNVAAGAKLRLGFAGTNRVDRIRLGGCVRVGVISAETYPDYILGEGALEAVPHGLIVILK